MPGRRGAASRRRPPGTRMREGGWPVADSDRLALAEGDDAQLWSRGQFLRASAGLFVAGAASLWLRPQIVDAARAVFGSPVEHGLVHLYQYDFFFVPNYMTWRVGTPLTV